jgi:hypothetical protein
MDTALAAKVIRIVAHELRKKGVQSPNYVAIGQAITAKIEAMPNAGPREIAAAVLGAN